jgi:NDP-sugar pyrophosphorylase family protein
MLNEDLPLFGYKMEPQDYLIDIGSMEKYRQANADYLSKKVYTENA